MTDSETHSYPAGTPSGSGTIHKVLACVIPLVLMMVFAALSPSSPFTFETSLLGNVSGEFWYCNTAVLWFGWRLGGETKRAGELPLKFWLSSIVIFAITAMLFTQSVWLAADASEANAPRYATYYIQYVLLTYLIVYLGHRKIGVKKDG